MDADLTELSELARSVAGEAAALVLAAVDLPREDVRTKSSATDFVTEVDRACEELIVKLIGAARPVDGLLGEEGASSEGTSGLRWVIDPIDGTTNFVHRHPGFAVSIAVERDGVSVVGVVCDVMRDEMFSATLGGGATLNGEPIQVAGADELSTSLIATGFAFDPERRRGQAELLTEVLPRVGDIRRMGAASVDLCSVACGRIDGYYERGLNRWDYAAGELIATEAGAIAGAIEGGRPVPGSMIATAPAIFEDLRSLVE
jgi:myo-inositol-1(or 4)-monophosphatase